MAELEFRAEVLATQPPPAMELGKAKSRATAGVMLLVGGLLAVPYLDRDATIDPLALDFGAQEIGTVSPGQALLVSNAGWSTFQVEGVAILGEHLLDFQVVEDECSGGAIAPRRSCRMLLQFSPRDRRERRARLPITASDDRTLQQVQLSGGGMLLSVGVQPGFVDFGDQLLKTASPPQSVAIANVGDSPLRIHQIEIDRRGRAAFRMSGQNCSDRLLEPAAQCRMQVRFALPALVGGSSGQADGPPRCAGTPSTGASGGDGHAGQNRRRPGTTSAYLRTGTGVSPGGSPSRNSGDGRDPSHHLQSG